MKVKNVIKGHLSHEEIERITIIDTKELTTIFAGLSKKWLNPQDIMMEYKKEVENMEVIKSEVNCGCQLFVFFINFILSLLNFLHFKDIIKEGTRKEYIL